MSNRERKPGGDSTKSAVEENTKVSEEEVVVPVADRCSDPAINLTLTELAQLEDENRGRGGDYILIDGYRIPAEVYNKLKLGV